MADYTLNEKETFEYTYSAKQQEEIEKIKSKYLPKEESKMDKLRKLDRQAETPGQVAAISVGTAGALILGAGMSMCMVWAGPLFIPGILIGIIGMVMVGASYPLYLKITKERRAKIADKILALSEELSLQ